LDTKNFLLLSSTSKYFNCTDFSQGMVKSDMRHGTPGSTADKKNTYTQTHLHTFKIAIKIINNNQSR
jgi:hypothetical protein